MSQVISQVLSKVEVLVQQARQHEEKLASIVKEISQLTSSTAGLTVSPDLETVKRRGRPPGSSKKVAVAISGDISNVVPKRRGRPPGSGKKTSTVPSTPSLTATGKRRGRPPGSGKKVAPPLSAMPTPAPVSAPTIHLLPTVIWEILNRGESEWRKALPELPEDVTGLKATELLHIIQQEMDLSNEQLGDLATQISTSLRKLSNLKRIVRGDYSRYSIESGATEPSEAELAVEVESTEE